jgi:hypothetical protein
MGLQLRAPVQSSETADCAWKEQRNAFLGFLGFLGVSCVLIQIELMLLRPFQNRETWSLTEAMAPSMQVWAEVWRSSQADSQTTEHGRLCCRYLLVRDGNGKGSGPAHCRPKKASSC